MAASDPDFEDWINRARAFKIEDVVSILGIAQLKKVSNELVGPCPHCGGTDRFQVNVREGVFLCRGSGAAGDGIAMVQHVQGLEFVAACEYLIGEPPPRSDQKLEPQPINHERESATHEARKDKELLDEVKDKEQRAKKASRSQVIFDSGIRIMGTWAEQYLLLRGIILKPEQAEFLRFIPSHPFYEGQNPDGSPKCIGEWPAMVALRYDEYGHAVGIHCTYLDRDAPIKATIEVHDDEGRPVRLNPRKAYGTAGLIWLSPIRPIMAIGEGIETTLSWYELGLTQDDIGIAAAGALGCLSGKSTGTIPHPTLRNRTIPNGIPNMDEPGPAMPIPAEVRELIFIGDADKNPENTRAHLLTGMRRYAQLGRDVSCHLSPLPAGEQKFDWNDVLLHARKAEKAGAA